MRILFIGGSNLVIKNGLSSILPSYLASHFNRDIEEIVNIAVPGTGSLFGVHNLLELKDAEKFDFVFIEYGINDYSLFTRNPVLWKDGFSGLIKTVQVKCPNAAIVTILLGRRDKKFHVRQQAMHAQMREISEELNVVVADIDSLFRSERMAAMDFSQFYIDGNHFKPPLVTNFIATVCTLKAVEAASKKRRGRQASAKTFKSPFQAWDLSEKLGAQYKNSEFRNSKFELKSITLEAGNEIALNTNEYPCGISFVSHKTSGSLLINVDGQKSILHSMHRRVHTGEFDFLLRHNPFYWLTDELSASAKKKELSITMRVIDSDDIEWDEGIIRPSYEMIPVRPGRGSAVHLVGLTTIK